MEKPARSSMNLQRAAALVLALCLLTMGAAEAGGCTVKNRSSQPVIILPAVGVAVAVEVAVGATVVLPATLQNCYIKNKHSGHQKGPVALASNGIYVIVDAVVAGEVNLCVGSLLGGILSIGAVIIGGI